MGDYASFSTNFNVNIFIMTDITLSSISELESSISVSQNDLFLATTRDDSGNYISRKVSYGMLSGSIGLGTAAFKNIEQFAEKNHTHGQYLESIPKASTVEVGGFKTGYEETGDNHPVYLDNEARAYVSVKVGSGNEHKIVSRQEFNDLCSQGKVQENTIYCISDDVFSVSSYYTEGTKIATLSIDDKSTDIFVPSVKISSDYTQENGRKVATISVGNETTDIYIPRDCVSYVISSGPFKSGGLRGKESVIDGWYRIYSDGYYEQCGECDNVYATQNESYTDQYYNPVKFKCELSKGYKGFVTDSGSYMGKTGFQSQEGLSAWIWFPHKSESIEDNYLRYYWKVEGYIKQS